QEEGERHSRWRYPELFGSRFILPPGLCGSVEQLHLTGYHFDAESFLLAAHDMDGFKLAALYTLQHGLAGDTQRALCLSHRQEVLAGISVEPGLDVLGQANAPRRSRRHLLACDDAIVE